LRGFRRGGGRRGLARRRRLGLGELRLFELRRLGLLGLRGLGRLWRLEVDLGPELLVHEGLHAERPRAHLHGNGGRTRGTETMHRRSHEERRHEPALRFALERKERLEAGGLRFRLHGGRRGQDTGSVG
jgi:hypothetical protein